MKVAILGGGLTSLTIAYNLSRKGYGVSVFEKREELGGMASGFKIENWDWFLDKTYHHVFASDAEILNLAREVGFNDFVLKDPSTASIFFNNGFKTYPMDTPINLLRLREIPFLDRLRTGFVLLLLKLSPFLSYYETHTATNLLKTSMGEKSWDKLWKELFRKKFGKYAGKILASFFWARIKKRTKKLAYPQGGFQAFVNHLETVLKRQGVLIFKDTEINLVENKQNAFSVLDREGRELGEFDLVVSTLPSPVSAQVLSNVLSTDEIRNLSKLKYLNAVQMIVESKERLFRGIYWANISTPRLNSMGIIEHTNMINEAHYGNNKVVYLANYVSADDKLWKMNREEIKRFYLHDLESLKPGYTRFIKRTFIVKIPFAQPVFDREFLKNKPRIKTSRKNLFLANLDMTYPYDRGTNYAVKLGNDTTNQILNSKH